MIVCYVYLWESRLDEAILMSIHNITFHDKIRKKPLTVCFLELLEEFVETEKRVRIIHGKRAIRVRAIEVILYKGYVIVFLNIVMCFLFQRKKTTGRRIKLKDILSWC